MATKLYMATKRKAAQRQPAVQQFEIPDDLDLNVGVIKDVPFKPAEPVLPVDSAGRKAIPLTTGFIDYFPAAMAAVAEVSRAGNEKHNPGEPLHHARGKSMDHADCLVRHLMERGTLDAEDGLRHTAKVAWRAMAMLQEELEDAGAPLARGAKL